MSHCASQPSPLGMALRSGVSRGLVRQLHTAAASGEWWFSGRWGTKHSHGHLVPVPDVPRGGIAVASLSHALLIAPSGVVWAAGQNYTGQLGLGTATTALQASMPHAPPHISAAAVGLGFSWLATNESLYACGSMCSSLRAAHHSKCAGRGRPRIC